MIPALSPFLKLSDMTALLPSSESCSRIFRERRQKFFGFDYSISFSTARSALYQILKAHRVENKIVLVSAYTCSAVVESIRNSGNEPAFLDLDPDSFNATITDELIGSFKGRLGAVITTGMFGIEPSLPIGMPRDRDWLLIYDAALAPATLHSDAAAKSDYSLLSCCIRKPYTCLGGGIAFTGNESKFTILADHCESRISDNTARRAKKWLLAVSAFPAFAPGVYTILDALRRNTRLVGSMVHPAAKSQIYSDPMYRFQERMGIRHLGRLEAQFLHRRRIGDIYCRELSAHYAPVEKFWRRGTAYSHIPFLHPQRGALRCWLRKRGFDSDTVFDYVAGEDNSAADRYPRARFVADSIINLPIHPRLTEIHVKRIVDAIRSFDSCQGQS